MEKIEFKDLPNTTTPITAENLNLLQDNIENETGITIFKGTKIYAEGDDTKTYTLPESSSNYKKIKVVIQRGTDYGMGETTVYINSSTNVGHAILHYTDSNTGYQIIAVKVIISEATITFEAKHINIFTHVVYSQSNNDFTLIGIYGYK